MFAHFQDYAEHIRPALGAAFSGQLTCLLGETAPHYTGAGGGLLTGGKKLRGSLLCLVAETLGGTLEAAMPRALAVELIHTATLIHDDFVDQHRTRRDMAAIWTLDGARRAVLLGDIIFASAIQMMSELGRDDGLIVSRAIAEVSKGAYREPLSPAAFFEGLAGDLDESIYGKITYLKTGALFGAAGHLGAVAAGVGEGRRLVWRRYGEHIGMAYQIADDLQDMDRFLSTGSITMGNLALLAPALLCFARHCKPHLLAALRHGAPSVCRDMTEYFRTAAAAMTVEMERCLHAAAGEIDGEEAGSRLGRLAYQAPWDIIRMFNGPGSEPSWP